MNLDLLKTSIEHEFRLKNLFSKCRKDNYIRGRAVLYALLRETGMKLEAIAEHCGFRTHSTVMKGLEYFDYLYECDSHVQKVYDSLLLDVKPNAELKREIISHLDYIKTESLLSLNEFLKTLR